MARRAFQIIAASLIGLLLLLVLGVLLVAVKPDLVNRPLERAVRSYLDRNPLADSARIDFASLEWKPFRGLVLHGLHVHRKEEGVYLHRAEFVGLGWRNGLSVRDLRLDSLLVTGVPSAAWASWFAPWVDEGDTSTSELAVRLDHVGLNFWARSLEGDTLVSPSELELHDVRWSADAQSLRAALGLEVPAFGRIAANLVWMHEQGQLDLAWSRYRAGVQYRPDSLRFFVHDDSSNHVSFNVVRQQNAWIVPSQTARWDALEIAARGAWGETERTLELAMPGLIISALERNERVVVRLDADSSRQQIPSGWRIHGVLEGSYFSDRWNLKSKAFALAAPEFTTQVTNLILEGGPQRWDASCAVSDLGMLRLQGVWATKNITANLDLNAPFQPLAELPSVRHLSVDWNADNPYSGRVTARDSAAEVAVVRAEHSGSQWKISGSWGAYQLASRWNRSPDQWQVPGMQVSSVASQMVAGRIAILDSMGLEELWLHGPKLDVRLTHGASGTLASAQYRDGSNNGSWLYRAHKNGVRHDIVWNGAEHATIHLEAKSGDSLHVALRAEANHDRGGMLALNLRVWPYGNVWTTALAEGHADAWYRPADGDSVRLQGALTGASWVTYDFLRNRLAFEDPLFWSSPEGQIAVGGALSPQDVEVLRVQARNVRLPFWTRVAGLKGVDLGGSLSADVVVVGSLAGWQVSGGLETQGLKLQGQELGAINLELDYAAERDLAEVNLRWDFRDTAVLHLNGTLGAEGLRAQTQALSIPLRWARPFADGAVNDLNGRLRGTVALAANADLSNLTWKGSGFWANANLNIPTVGLGLRGNPTWNLTQDALILGPSRMADHRNVGSAELSAQVNFTGSELVDLKFKTERMVVLDLPPSRKADFYGYVVASGSGRLRGTASALKLDVQARPADSSVFVLPLDAPVSLDEVEFLSFRSRADVGKPRKRTNDNFRFDLHLDLDVTQDVLARLILDETVGDVIEARGSGPLQLDVPWVGDMALRGNLTLDRGTYLFTLRNLINKPFSLVPGGSIRWTGDPYAAQMNLTALYRTRADVKDYLGLPEAGRQNVDVRLRATGPLFQPQLAFDVQLPNAGELAQAALTSRLSYADERTTQVLSLLTISSFWLGSSPLAAQGMQAVESNTTQVLASQFTNFMTQGLGADWDVNLAYSTNAAAARREMEASIGRSFLDDRLKIQTEWGIPIGQAQPSIGLGDVEVRYQLSDDGRWSAKAYQRRNDQMMQTGVVGSQRQGIGLRFEQSSPTWRQFLKSGN